MEAALAEVVTRYRRRLFSLALARVRDVDAADDIVQTALLRAVARGGLDAVADPAAWLVVVVENLCRNHLRRSRPAPALPDEPATSAPAPEAGAERRELGRLLRDAIRALPEAYRVPVWLVHVEGLEQKEVAQVTGARLFTVKSALARGRRILRERLGRLLKKAGYLDSEEG
ncbi:MAG: RNA polymerase sigma factor [Planctomycetota bacterium]|jgi:RNA polymerase sigma-70 factor (ECF subfamily)